MNKQLRLFVGIFPSRSTQEQLNKEAENLSEKLQTKVRILAPEILHLTVKFIGNVDETQLIDLTAAFLKATGNLPSASLQIRQFRLFPSHRKPRVVAAQIERSPELDYIFHHILPLLPLIGKLSCVSKCVKLSVTMATNLSIDPQLLEEALRIGGLSTKKDTVNQALKENNQNKMMITYPYV